MKIPCKQCILYAICQNKVIWDLLDECIEFEQYLKDIASEPKLGYSWGRKLHEFQNATKSKGES